MIPLEQAGAAPDDLGQPRLRRLRRSALGDIGRTWRSTSAAISPIQALHVVECAKDRAQADAACSRPARRSA